jgi:hypothetical protein
MADNTTTTDINLYETGSGGDFAILANDLMMGESLFQNIYLALFGGNYEASTKSAYLPNELRYDYWGNDLAWGQQKTKQFNSETERTLRSTALNSQGRIAILQSVNNDLAYMKGVVDFTVDVQIKGISKAAIIITLNQKTNQQDKVLQLIFDNIKNEVIIDVLI